MSFVFRTLSNICDRAFCENIFTKISIRDVLQGPESTSVNGLSSYKKSSYFSETTGKVLATAILEKCYLSIFPQGEKHGQLPKFIFIL